MPQDIVRRTNKVAIGADSGARGQGTGAGYSAVATVAGGPRATSTERTHTAGLSTVRWPE
eukprot:2437255-Lingulodinium_polyedra.AAC.1